MAAQAKNQKDSAMAAMLVRTGFPHGRRKTSPYPNSGGLTAVKGAVGSAAFQRRVRKEAP